MRILSVAARGARGGPLEEEFLRVSLYLFKSPQLGPWGWGARKGEATNVRDGN